ncbi:hypothetical protein QBC40DRAFT_307683 [Triangularia verruculosa]|uniref:DUF6604 domain-containing protein n=1 Tax=Triangularia verruculosa TaxID=2587418 RepID=A0AAN6XGK3_9PEZI|nr:hypothetical protein QBC40DRAFT_307683 [Triangularia verruculosa]
MLPPNLTSTYQQYKKDTDIVASWLAQTGMMSGCPDDLLKTSALNNANASKGGGRLKGKARKNAKAAGAPTTSAKGQAKSKHVLAIRNFVPLAQFIVEHHKDKEKASVDLPTSFSKAIERAISVRKGFAQLLEKAGATINMSADEKHRFFVGVLEKVRDTLKPLFWQSTSIRTGLEETEDLTQALPSVKASTPVASTNPFEILNAYDLPEVNLSAEEPAADGQPVVQESKPQPILDVLEYEAESFNSEADRFLIFLTLARDVHAIREQVKKLWKAYHNRELSLTSVAVATNTAVDVARSIEEEVSILFKPDGYTTGMLGKLALSISALMGKTEPKPSVRGSYPYDLALYSVLDVCMINASLMVNGWLSLAGGDSDSATMSYNGQYGWYDKTVPYQSLSEQKKFEQDRCAFSELCPEFDRLGRLGFNNQRDKAFTTVPPVVDELSRGMYLMAADGLGDNKVPLWLILAASLHLDVVRMLGDEIDRPYREMVAFDHLVDQTIKDHNEYHKHATFWREGDNVINAALAAAGVNVKPVVFLKRHPLYCGLWVADMRSRLHESGVGLNYCFGSILYVGHLYNALQAEGLIPEDKKWDDMELFFKTQGGRDKFFIGKAPSSIDEYHKQFCLVMGFSAGNFAPNTRNKGKMKASAKGPRSLPERGRVSQVFKKSFQPNSSRINLNADHVNTILYPNEPASPRGTVVSSPVQLIDLLAHALEAEIPELEPDYLLEYQLPFLVGYIFRSLIGDQGTTYGRITTPMRPPTTDLFLKAAQVYLDTLGGQDGELERTRIKNQIEQLHATSKMKKVIPDEQRAAQSGHGSDDGEDDWDSDDSDSPGARLLNSLGPDGRGQALMDMYHMMLQMGQNSEGNPRQNTNGRRRIGRG